MTGHGQQSRIFIRPVARIQNCQDINDFRRASALLRPINGDCVLSIPVANDDTLEETRNILINVLKIKRGWGRLNSLNSDSQKPYEVSDIISAAEFFIPEGDNNSLFDSEASPYNRKDCFTPTTWLVQLIPLDNSMSRLDLYVEILERIKDGEFDLVTEGLIPKGFIKETDTCYKYCDGALFRTESQAQNKDYPEGSGQIVNINDLLKENKRIYENHWPPESSSSEYY